MSRRTIALLSVTALVSGLVTGVTTTATAADLGTVTVNYVPGSMSYAITPNSLTAAAGDTFTLANTMTSGNSSSSYSLNLQNDSGEVSLGGNSCTDPSTCTVLDVIAGNATGVFTVVSTGTVKVLRNYNNSISQIGTLYLGVSAPTVTPTPTFTLSFNPNGGECSVLTSGPISAGTWIDVPDQYQCTRPGLTLTGFSSSATNQAGSVFIPAGGPTAVTGDNTLYAQWKIRVIADSTALECPGNETTDIDVGESVKLPEAKVCGERILVGWSLLAGENEAITYQPGQVITPTANQTLFGAWAPVRTVTLVCSVISGSPREQVSVGREQPLTLPSTCSGAQVSRWTTNADGSGTSTSAGQTVRTPDNLTLYSQAESSPVTIRWSANGGSCPSTSTRVTWGSTFDPIACSRTGFTITDWQTAATGGTSLLGKPLRANTTAVPIWTKTPVLGALWTYKCLTPTSVTASWNATSRTFEAVLPTGTACPNPPYVLGSWNTSADGTGTSYQPGATITISSDTWVYAQWSVPVTFDFNVSGTQANCPTVTSNVPLGQTFTFPGQDSCTRTNYAISSWTTNIEGQAITVAPSGSGTALVPATFTATWAPPITITFNPDQGTCKVATVVIGTGGSYQMPGVDDCTRTGYRLSGWSFVPNAPRGPFFFEPGSTFPAFIDLTVIAQWTSTSHCVAAPAPGVDWHDCDKRFLTLSNVNLTGANLTNALLDKANLSGANLTGAALTGTSLTQTNLAGATLTGANFRDKLLTGTNLSEATLSGANLTNTLLIGTLFTGANLTGADFTGAVPVGADFTRANLSSGNVTRVDFRTSKVASINLTGTTVDNANMSNLDLYGATFKQAQGSSLSINGAKAGSVNFTGANLPSLTAAGTDLSAANLTSTTLTGADLTRSNMSGVTATGSTLSRAIFTSTNLKGANLNNSTLSGSTWKNVTLNSVNLTNARMDGISHSNLIMGTAQLGGANLGENTFINMDFSAATLKRARFNASNLTGGNFTGRNLNGVDFSRANLSNVNFNEARTDKIGEGCQAENYSRSSQVTVKTPMRNLPTVPWMYVEEIYNKRGTKLIGREIRYENRTWGLDDRGDFIMFCARPL